MNTVDVFRSGLKDDPERYKALLTLPLSIPCAASDRGSDQSAISARTKAAVLLASAVNA